MNEQMLVDLIGDIDISLLYDDFIEDDAAHNRGFILSRYYQERKKAGIGERFDIQIKTVKNKVNHMKRIVSGIVATIVLIMGIAMLIIRKKSAKFAVLS